MELILINKKLHIYFAGFVAAAIFGLVSLAISSNILGSSNKIIYIGFSIILITNLLVIALGHAYSGYIGNKKEICLVKKTYRPRVHEYILETSAYKNPKVLRGKYAKKANDIKILTGVILAFLLSITLAISLAVFFAQIPGMLQ